MSGVKWEAELKGYRLLFRGVTLPEHVKKVSRDITQSSYQWSHINIQKEITGGTGPYYLTNNVDSKNGAKSYKFSNIMKKLSQKGIVDLVDVKILGTVLPVGMEVHKQHSEQIHLRTTKQEIILEHH